MNTGVKIIISILLIGLLGAGAWVVYREYGAETQVQQQEQSETINFSHAGNLVKDSSRPNAWYLVYELPGSPALRVELHLADDYNEELHAGNRVMVEGYETGVSRTLFFRH
jgi:hypothetical protein